MLKKLLILFLTLTMIFSLASCKKEKHAKSLFDELGFSTETISSWQGEIQYINENRGTFDETYAKVKYNEENPFELLSFINCFEGAQATESPSSFIFSAEGMSEYVINFYIDKAEEPALSFYYFSGDNILTRVIRSTDEKTQVEIVDYEFYEPYGDLLSFLTSYRDMAIEPEIEENTLSLNQKQLIAAVSEEELEERMEYQEDEGYVVQEGATTGEIPGEYFEGELPEDAGTGCKLYDNRDIESLTDEEILLLARIVDDKGDPMNLQISFVEFNSNYTIVNIAYPDADLMEQFTNLKINNAIVIKRADIDLDKRIVFVDDMGEVVYVIVPFAN